MSKLDRIKAEISFHEKMFFAAVAAVLALMGWLAANIESDNTILLFLGVCALLGSVIFGLQQYRVVKRLLKALEDV